MGEAVEFFPCNNGFSSNVHYENNHMILHQNQQEENQDSWFEEVIDDDLKWSFALNRYLSQIRVYFLLVAYLLSLAKFKFDSFITECLSILLSRVLHKGTSVYQDIALLDTKRFGKVGNQFINIINLMKLKFECYIYVIR